jgi:uncharacterized membrane protein
VVKLRRQVEHFAFIWQPGGPLGPIPLPFASSSRAVDVNSRGTVIGTVFGFSRGGPTGIRGFVSNGVESSYLPPLPGHVISEALGVNEAGTIVGMSNGSPTPQAVYWNEGVPTALLLPIGPTSMAEDINNMNQICGWMGIDPSPSFGATPFIWDNGKTTSLPLPPYAAANSGTATALNNLGDACGHFFVENPKGEGYLRRACAWIDGKFIDLGLLPGADVSRALDINDAREIVGNCEGPGLAADVGFLWRDGEMMKLNDLLPDGMFTRAFGNAINNTGQIAGSALLPPNSDRVAIRLTPALPLTPGDTNCSASVDVDDLVNVILDWNPPGPVGGNPTDVNRDNRIDIEDLIEVIRRWSSPR